MPEPDEVAASDVRDDLRPLPVVDSRSAFDGKVWNVRSDQVRLPTGDVVVRDVIEHPGAVGIVALDDDNRVLLVQQYRHPVGRLLWEAPAGLLDAAAEGEEPWETAARELFEETGYRARDWRVLVDLFTSPGGSDEALRLFLARGLTRAPVAERHEGEHEEADMPIAWVPLDRAVADALEGRLHNPTAVTGVLAAFAAMAGGGFDGLRPHDAPWPERRSAS